MDLKNKRIIITAGPTCVPIDKVRVISNIATAKTGIILAKKANKLGVSVTLLLGPMGEIKLNKNINIKRYSFFDELDDLLKKELLTKKYDVVIHSAAVSDYKPKKLFTKKIKSNIRNFRLDLEPTFKIVDKIKKYSPDVFLVMFKLEFGASFLKMTENARKAMQNADADLCVINTFSENNYKAMVINRNKVLYRVDSKEKLTKKLLETINCQFN